MHCKTKLLTVCANVRRLGEKKVGTSRLLLALSKVIFKVLYNTCRHFCVYCYANTSREAVLKNKDLFLLKFEVGKQIFTFRDRQRNGNVMVVVMRFNKFSSQKAEKSISSKCYRKNCGTNCFVRKKTVEPQVYDLPF